MARERLASEPRHQRGDVTPPSSEDRTKSISEGGYDVDEIIPQLEEELYSRLDATLSSKDKLAIKAALANAVVRGFSRGMAAQTDQINKLLADDPTSALERVDVEFGDFGVELDVWAEQYGDARGAGEN